MLAYLRASRFGLSWAHDAFYFARHMLMHFHAYVPYIQYICVYLNCLGLFWVFLSSPLLSLVYINASMASKRKYAPSQNPLRSRASSSPSNPTPSHIRFRDEDAWKDFSENFSENFSQQGVHSERRVILADFAGTNLPNVIHSRGWESLCDVPVTCPSMLIQEFYSNMHGIDSSVPLFHTRVRGVHSCHTEVGIWCAPCPEGRASWLPRLWASKDYVQRRAYVHFLWASLWLGRSSIYSMFNLC